MEYHFGSIFCGAFGTAIKLITLQVSVIHSFFYAKLAVTTYFHPSSQMRNLCRHPHFLFNRSFSFDCILKSSVLYQRSIEIYFYLNQKTNYLWTYTSYETLFNPLEMEKKNVTRIISLKLIFDWVSKYPFSKKNSIFEALIYTSDEGIIYKYACALFKLLASLFFLFCELSCVTFSRYNSF